MDGKFWIHYLHVALSSPVGSGAGPLGASHRTGLPKLFQSRKLDETFAAVADVLCPAVLSEKREIGSELTNHISKFLPALRAPVPGLGKCADWLEKWIEGSLPPVPLLEVGECLGHVVEPSGNHNQSFIFPSHSSIEERIWSWCAKFYITISLCEGSEVLLQEIVVWYHNIF